MTPTFSLAVVSLNNPEYVSLLLKGLRKNTRNPFEILLYGNCADHEFDKLATDNNDIVTVYKSSQENLGISRPLNALFKEARAPYFIFIDDDMYPCPNWDVAMLKAIDPSIRYQYLAFNQFIPKYRGRKGGEGFNYYDFGDDIYNFREDDFNTKWAEAREITIDQLGYGGNFMMLREIWEELGGFDPEFLRGEDIEFKARFVQHATKSVQLGRTGVLPGQWEFRCVADACLYHFLSVGQGKSKLQYNSTSKFAEKFGLNASDFWSQVVKASTLKLLPTECTLHPLDMPESPTSFDILREKVIRVFRQSPGGLRPEDFIVIANDTIEIVSVRPIVNTRYFEINIVPMLRDNQIKYRFNPNLKLG